MRDKIERWAQDSHFESGWTRSDKDGELIKAFKKNIYYAFIFLRRVNCFAYLESTFIRVQSYMSGLWKTNEAESQIIDTQEAANFTSSSTLLSTVAQCLTTS